MNATSTVGAAGGMPSGAPPAGMQPPNGFGGPGGAGGGVMQLLGPYGGVVAMALLAITLIVLAIAFWRILRNAGYAPALGLLMLVPVVNLGVALWMAFAEWPILTERARMRTLIATRLAGETPGGASGGPAADGGGGQTPPSPYVDEAPSPA